MKKVKTMRTLEIYKDRKGKWRWKLIGANNSDKLANGGQGYANNGDCLDMAQGIVKGEYRLVNRVKTRKSKGEV